MEKSLVSQFRFSFKEILIDEIALEGLEGVGCDLLWRRVEKRISSPVTEKMKARFWNFIIYCDAISLYEIPEPLPYVEIKDRFEIIDEETGNVNDPPDPLDGPYEYNPIDTDHGSSINYKTRQRISKETLKEVPYERVLGQYGDKLVIVASVKERWKALAPHLSMSQVEMSKTQYCLLELIGKSRENGQMTIGNTNITKILKESKILFYNRKYLQDVDLIRVQAVTQVTGGRSVKGLLLRLRRFHQPQLLSMPKKGIVYEVTQHLLKQPNYTDTCKNVMDMNLLSPVVCKKLYKCDNAFIFETLNNLPPRKKFKPMTNRSMRLDPPSEDSSQSDEDTSERLQCQYAVKINLLRQAYENILHSGLNGLTQVELSEVLGVEYYTARNICRTFKAKNIVKEIFVDKGKQRMAKFVACASAGAVDPKYEEEKKKFLKFVEESKQAVAAVEAASTSEPNLEESDSDTEVPKKKLKLSKTAKDNEDIIPNTKTIAKSVTEIKCLDGLENIDMQPFLGRGKAPTMRQLKLANGILKTLRERVVVSGYMNLSTLAAMESNEPPIDNKGLKTIVQKLVVGGQVKLFKMSYPLWDKVFILICAAHVRITDPIIKTKYKEISLGILRKRRSDKEPPVVKNQTPVTRPLAMSIYPRYLKLQKLHEFIMKLVYFNDDENFQTTAPEGFSSLVDMIPEFTVEFVIGNMSSFALMSMAKVNIPQSMMQQKLRNVPGELFKTFLATPTLQNSWRQNLKVLSTLGLIQLVKHPATSDESYVLSYEFYVNRRASIINTTGDWPRDNVDREALKKSYYFETYQDVEKYWSDIYVISINTRIKIDPKNRSHKGTLYYPRIREEIPMHDNGQVYGNGLGPCGFDSSFYMEMAKLWAMCHTKLKQHALMKKPPIKMPKIKKSSKKPAKVKVPKKKIVKPSVNTTEKRNRLKASCLPKWNKEEDKLIMLCKAAITVISPVAHSGCLRLRDVVAKDILSLVDPRKTANTCHKRAAILESNTTLAYEKDCVINELRRYPHILKKYDGLYKTLRLQYSGNVSKVMTAARLPMLELIYVLMQLIRSEKYNKKTPCVALNLEEFYNKYTICPSTVNRNYNSYKSLPESGPMLAAIKEGIVMALMCSYRSVPRGEAARDIRAMLNAYPEHALRPAIEQLRRSGAVAARDKSMHNTVHQFHLKDIAQSSYKLSSSYLRHWICRMNAEFADNLMFSLDEELPIKDLKGVSELNCLLFESQACDVLDTVCESSPVIARSGSSSLLQDDLSVQDMIFSYNIKPGAVGLKSKKDIKKISELFENLNYEEPLRNMLRESQVFLSTDDIETEEKIVSHLKMKKRAASSFDELQKATGYDRETLINKLKTLESENIVKRLGFFENVIVLTKFSKHWTITVKDKRIVPTPWLTLDMDIRHDVFLKCAGTIVNKVFVKPGCTISYIAEECEFISTRAVQDICMTLEKCKCITLKTVYVSEPDLFSDDVSPECGELNPYAPVENILVFPMKDMLTRYSYIRKKMYDDEFYFEKT